MGWSYDPSMAADRDRVRFRLGDTVATDPLLQDEEIDVLLEDGGGVIETTIACAEALAMRFGRMAQSMTDDIGQSVNYGDRAARFRLLADRLRATLTNNLAIPFAGGISQTGKDTIRANSDRTAPAFTRQLHSTPGGQADD